MIYHRHNNDYYDSDFTCWNRFFRTCHADKVQNWNSVILETTKIVNNIGKNNF